MRDDISGLSFVRMFPEASMAQPGLPTLKAPGATSPLAMQHGSSFASELARASARTANLALLTTAQLPAAQRTPTQQRTMAQQTAAQRLAAQRATSTAKPYVSPLKANPYQRPTTTSMNRPQTVTTPPTTTSVTPRRPLTSTSPTTASKPASEASKVQPPKVVVPTDPSPALALSAYPHPNGDNGRGMHWIPTTSQPKSAVDRFVAEAQRMGVKWVTFLNNGADVGDNYYLVSKLVGAGIEPIMRLWTPSLQPIQGDVEAMVRHYTSMGMHYFQPYNEPNLNDEQPDGKVSVDRYLDNWISAAQAIIRGGGLPGFGSMAPGGDMDDQEFLTQALQGLKDRGQGGLLDKGWLSMHNYTHNHPIEEPYTDGFFKFRNYHKIISDALGRDIPIIGTEGGTFVGEQEDKSMPAADASTVARWATQAYTYMRDQREPWNFAYSFWTIANDLGGGTDPRFNAEALFKGDGSTSQVVSALRAMG